MIASDAPPLVPRHSVRVAATLLAASSLRVSSCCFVFGSCYTWLHSRRSVLVSSMPCARSPSTSVVVPSANGAEGARETYFFFFRSTCRITVQRTLCCALGNALSVLRLARGCFCRVFERSWEKNVRGWAIGRVR